LPDTVTRLRQIASTGSQSQQISQAIDWLKNNFTQQLSIDDLSCSGQHEPFDNPLSLQSMIAVSPLQFQKQLRQQEARRLMRPERMGAANGACECPFHAVFPANYQRDCGEKIK
jgi:transcriptional regulator GlxA family with amidase domain